MQHPMLRYLVMQEKKKLISPLGKNKQVLFMPSVIERLPATQSKSQMYERKTRVGTLQTKMDHLHSLNLLKLKLCPSSNYGPFLW